VCLEPLRKLNRSFRLCERRLPWQPAFVDGENLSFAQYY
jgi:hypothetical protein